MYPTTLTTAHDVCTIAQISDLHLMGKIGTHDSYRQFLAVLQLAMIDQPDLLILTGDLVNDGNSHAYDWLFAQLQDAKTPFLCLAGNHDVIHEIGSFLPFEQRIHLPITPDQRLIGTHRLQLDKQNWQILSLNTALMGRDDGQICQTHLAWLDDTLTQHQQSTLIALHHHPVAVGSAWIDRLILQNADEFWQIINRHPHASHIICGHVHQAQQIIAPTNHHCTVLTCPATARQFLPFADDFALDKLTAGLRLLQIGQNRLTSNIKRL